MMEDKIKELLQILNHKRNEALTSSANSTDEVQHEYFAGKADGFDDAIEEINYFLRADSDGKEG